MSDNHNNLFAEVQFDANGLPTSKAFDDIYFSTNNGLEETRYVFLKANNLAERFIQLASTKDSPCFTIGETGFGSGLNFLAAWQLFDETAPKDAHLHFISVEKYPLHIDDLKQTLALWPELTTYSEQLIRHYPLITGHEIHRLSLTDNVSLTLIINEATDGLGQLNTPTQPNILKRETLIDAWFLDGFAPAKNPEMWSDDLFSTIKQLSHSKTTLATFTAAALVKNGLKTAGFSLRKIPGYKKRDMLTAYIDSAAPTEIASSEASTCHQLGNQHAVIIGAGIAGCHSAHALAKRGWQVTVIEKNKTPANEGSGNPQGVVYVRLSHKRELLPRFNLVCLQYAQNYYRSFWKKNNRAAGECTGVLQLANTPKKMALYPEIIQNLGKTNNLVEFVDATTASLYSGTTLTTGGLYFPQSGWINPAELCRDLLDHPNIQLKTNCTVSSIKYNNKQWQLFDSENKVIANATTVIIANAAAACDFEQTAFLPLKPIRGQVSYLPATEESQKLTTTLCGEGYLAPASLGQHCLGATFNLKETDPNLRADDHEKNLQLLAELGPTTAALFNNTKNQTIQGRVGFRCTTPDYLPIVGQVPLFNSFIKDFAYLRKTAKAPGPITPQYCPGLYVNCAYGSRGLAYTPLGAQLLASLITQEPLPVSSDIADALNPSRFIMRNLARNKL